MGCGVRGGDEEIIHIDNKPSFGDHVSEGVVHKPLKCSGGVAEAKEHNRGFKEFIVSDESCLPLVTIFDVDVVIPPMNIKVSEVVGVFQLVHKVGDEREGVGIMGGVCVEVSVVLAGVEFTILLLNKEEGGCLEGVGRTNLSCGKVFFEEVLSSFLFIRRKWIDFAYLRHERLIEVDLVVVRSGRGDVIGCFFGEDLGEVGIFHWK